MRLFHKTTTPVRTCGICGKPLESFAMKCEYCGNWHPEVLRKLRIGNEAFHKLSAEDITMIKNGDLLIVTPSIVVLGLRMLLDGDLRNILQNKIFNIQNVKMSLMEKYKVFIYQCWTWSRPVILYTASKKGYEMKPDLECQLYTMYAYGAFSKQYTELTCRKISDSTQLRMISIGIHLPEQFDKVLEEMFLGTIKWEGRKLNLPVHHEKDFEPEPAHHVTAIESIGKLIFDHEVSFLDEVLFKLYGDIWGKDKAVREAYSKVFIVPEEDWDWEKVLTKE